jgi:undecaprenyl-diphosphatase
MILLKYILLGIVQCFTEPLPISSSGHLLIFKSLLNISTNDINFEIIVNFGSFIAISLIYKKEIIKIISDFFKYIKTKENKYKENYKYSYLIIIGCIPVGILGLLLKDKIDLISGNIKLVGIALLITSLALYMIKDINGKKEKKDITFIDAFIIGLVQTIALLPGISRSGSTIVGGMVRNLNKETAVNYSFMLYLPISIATLILGIIDLIKTPNINELILPYTTGMLISFIVTYITTKWFINIVKNGKLIYFSLYCLITGLIVILFI